MTQEKFYPVSAPYMLNLINDMIELQKGKCILSRTENGSIHFSTQMYGMCHTYRYCAQPKQDGCLVQLTMDDGDAADMVFRAFALLESLMQRKPDPLQD